MLGLSSLPKDIMGREQKKFTTEVIESPEDFDMQEQLGKTRKSFYALLSATLKNQDPLDPTPMHEIAQTTTAMQTAQQTATTNILLQKIMHNTSNNSFNQAQNMIGKIVYFDGAERDLIGGNIDFEFNIKNIDESSPAQLNVEIYDDQKNKVFTKQQFCNLREGMNHFEWNGLTTNGEKASKGTYKIEVSAIQGTKRIEIDTFRSGYVTEISSIGSKVFLEVDGKNNIEIGKISKLKQKQEDVIQHTLVDYIGKKILFDNNRIHVSGGNTLLAYKNDKSGYVRIDIKNPESDRLESIVYDDYSTPNAKKELSWNCKATKSFRQAEELHKDPKSYPTLPKLKDGTYTYDVYLKSGNAPWDKINTLSEETVVGIDLIDSVLITESGQRVDLNSIRSIRLDDPRNSAVNIEENNTYESNENTKKTTTNLGAGYS